MIFRRVSWSFMFAVPFQKCCPADAGRPDTGRHAPEPRAATQLKNIAEPALAWAKAAASGIDAATALMEEALKIQRAKLPATDPAPKETEKRLAIFQAMAGADSDE